MEQDVLRVLAVFGMKKELEQVINQALEVYENHCVLLRHLAKLIERRYASGDLDMDYLSKAADIVELDRNYVKETVDAFKADMEKFSSLEAAG